VNDKLTTEVNKSSLIHFETFESDVAKEWVLMIHGAGGSIRTWKRQVEHFRKEFNLLIVDLPGHGKSAQNSQAIKAYSFSIISEKVWDVVDHLGIQKVHLAGVSLGSIICIQIRNLYPKRILSVTMPGAIVKLNTKLKILASLSLGLAQLIGYRNFYKLSARIMLPRNNHKTSRDVFIRESQALTIEEFRKWTALYYNLNKTLKDFFYSYSNIPHLLIMGDQDHLFLSPAVEYSRHHNNSKIHILENCGHVVSIERSQEFNDYYLSFLRSIQ
jgi:pimeloyl-ACP methyl ester carboxylesterase